ncbi:MAG: hypothetical protein KDN05_16885, partial [Verrucomicrobiae bacterium]|nr:hypothetical protein [Verrucomicrobiae bacterium]
VSFEARFHSQGGHEATIRYENKAGLVSNAGPGFWDPDERDIANSPFQINALTLCDRHLPMVDEDLSDHGFVGRKVAKIDLQTKFRTTRACRLLCDHLLTQSDGFADEWREEARARLEAMRARNGAAESPASFAALCLDTLEKVSEDGVFGSPATYPDLCWQALATLGRETENPDELPWDRLFGLMESRLPAADFEELGGMARVLGQECYVHGFVPDSFLMAGMKSGQREFQSRCVSLLLHRGATHDIIRIAAALDLDGRFAVTKVLAAREVLVSDRGPIIDFMRGMANQEPERTLDAIQGTNPGDRNLFVPLALRSALSPYLRRTAFKGLEEETLIDDHEEQRRMTRAMEVGFRDHIEVLKRLAGSKAYYEQRSTSTQHGTRVEKIYFMAAAARRALAAKGMAP